MSSTFRFDQMKSMGVTNAGWGVCGFTSSLYAMYHLNPGARGKLINAPKPFTVLAEIKTYLEMLRAEGKQQLLSDIEDFTRTFGVVGGVDFSKFTVSSYVQYINASAQKYVNASGDVDGAIFADSKFSIALPPHAVVDYLQRMWDYGATAKSVDPGGDAIVGVKSGSGDNSGKPYGGLIHYVYRKDQRIYSWGRSFTSLEDADADFVFCWAIQVAKK